jgi:hypothetical protein
MSLAITIAALSLALGVACGWGRISKAVGQQSAPAHAGHTEAADQHAGRGGAEGEMKTVFNETERETKTFAVNGTPQVNVDNFEGSIKIVAWDRPEVAVTAVKMAIDKQALGGNRLSASERRGGIAVETAFTKEMRVIRLGGTHMHTRGAYVELELSVPSNANLRVRSGNGPLSVSGVSGQLDLRTEHGPVEVRDGGGRLVAYTNNGLVSVVNFVGEVDASEMGRDGMVLDGRFNRLKATTGGGPVSLALPEGTDADIEANTRQVIDEGLNAAEQPTSTREVKRLRLGKGGPVFTLRVNMGTLTLRRSNVAARASAGVR